MFASWIQGPSSFNRFGKFLSTIFLNGISVPFFLSSPSVIPILILFFLMESVRVEFFHFIYSQFSSSNCVISRFLSLISLTLPPSVQLYFLSFLVNYSFLYWVLQLQNYYLILFWSYNIFGTVLLLFIDFISEFIKLPI